MARQVPIVSDSVYHFAKIFPVIMFVCLFLTTVFSSFEAKWIK